MHYLDSYKFCPRCGADRFNPFHNDGARKCEDCGCELYKNPLPGAVGLIFDDEGRLIAGRRAKDPHKGSLGLIGGFVDIKESAEQALIREAKEELNIDIKITKYLFSMPNDYEYKGYEMNPLDIFFEAKLTDKNNMTADASEVSEILFIDKDKINPDEFGLPSNKKALERYLSGG